MSQTHVDQNRGIDTKNIYFVDDKDTVLNYYSVNKAIYTWYDWSVIRFLPIYCSPTQVLIASYAPGLLFLWQKKNTKTQKIPSAEQCHLCQIPMLMTTASWLILTCCHYSM